ncbi:hypothetical protein [Candidatus Manganitrophus noduliformans]|uniref:Apea-like HEPN domain-containing protein n=1 Tax=Candidatus Manganitrophus noduliformans TaxID=2606439 RepID=A0A7X6DRI4_9BACT|nr:hypothetical protein [Candidatus Manganitrophus noduliformans]NKE71902.1 hypothetical protein [Candidatus Manganitrophus noduliformans]
MPQLVAHFDVESLPGQCLIALPNKEIIVHSAINGFDVEIQLIVNESWRAKHKSDNEWTRRIERLLVRVSRNEVEFPPPVYPNDKGHLDYTIQSEYFCQRIEAFGHVAREATNRMIRFFRFLLRTPSLQEFPANHQYFSNAKWTDENNKIVGKAGVTIVSEKVPGLYGELGVKKLNLETLGALEDFIGHPISLPLTQQLLSDAQSAWFEGNLRRAILELAIACEIAVKRQFFANDSPAGAAFDYLEDKAQVNVRVLELMDRVTLEAFGKSFKTEYPNDYKNIDYLFRCRNKVAHRGKLIFRNDSNQEITVNGKTVSDWWGSAIILMEWLSAL